MEKKKEKKNIFVKFKLNTHTAFERFFRTFLMSTLALIFVIIYCFRANVNERSSLFQNVAVYSDSFQSSRSLFTIPWSRLPIIKSGFPTN